MKFMTQGTLRNMPQYLADDRARAESKKEDERRKTKEEQEEEIKKMIKEAGRAFMSSKDKSAQGIMNKAEELGMGPEQTKIMFDMLGQFKNSQDPMMTVTNEDGSKSVKRLKAGDQIAPKPTPGLIDQLNEEGATVRGYDGEGVKVKNAPDPTLTYDRDASGKETLVPKAAGVTRQPFGNDTGGQDFNKVPDSHQKGKNYIQETYGYNSLSGWKDTNMERKSKTAAGFYAKLMEGKSGDQMIPMANKAMEMTDKLVDGQNALDEIPEDSLTTSVAIAKTAAKKAIDRGVDPKDVEADMKAKGWDDKSIKKALGTKTTKTKTTDTADPLGIFSGGI